MPPPPPVSSPRPPAQTPRPAVSDAVGGARPGHHRPLPRLRPQGWTAAVFASTLVLVLVGLILGVSWLASEQTRTSTYVAPPVSRVVLRVASGSVEVLRGTGFDVQVQRTDHFAFGHRAVEQRTLTGGVLRVSSRCLRIVIGSCSSSYRLTVPDSVTLGVRTTSGDVHFDGFRGNAQIVTGSGAIAVDAYCGFRLSATSASGSIRVATACAPLSLDLLSVTGDITALVPPGRYSVHAASNRGSTRVTGVTSNDRAPFSIHANSASGNVRVEGGL